VAWSDGQTAHESLVARAPPDGDGLFPVYDLAAQGRVQDLVAGAGLPAVAPLAVELDDTWVVRPFLSPASPGAWCAAQAFLAHRCWG